MRRASKSSGTPMRRISRSRSLAKASTASEDRASASVMGNADILFLKNHGVIVAGPTIAEAWDDLYYLERAAQVQLMAMATQRDLKPVPEPIARRAYEQMRLGDAESARAHLHSAMRRLSKGRLPLITA